MFRRNQLDLARRLTELDDGFDEFALGLQIDAVIVEADNPLHGTGEHLVFGVDAGRFIQQLDVEALVLEVAERLGQLGGQINLFLVTADHDGDFSSARADGADKAMVATSAVVAAESSRIRASDMASSLCSFTAPLSLPSLLRDNMGTPVNSYGTNLSSSFQGKAENQSLRIGKPRLANMPRQRTPAQSFSPRTSRISYSPGERPATQSARQWRHGRT